MKNLILALLLITIMGCKKEVNPKEVSVSHYVTKVGNAVPQEPPILNWYVFYLNDKYYYHCHSTPLSDFTNVKWDSLSRMQEFPNPPINQFLIRNPYYVKK